GGKGRREGRTLVVGPHGYGAAIGAGRLRTDVDDVGALGDHAVGVVDRNSGIQELPAVGEGVWRDVENAHPQRTAKRQQTGEGSRSGAVCGGGGWWGGWRGGSSGGGRARTRRA